MRDVFFFSLFGKHKICILKTDCGLYNQCNFLEERWLSLHNKGQISKRIKLGDWQKPKVQKRIWLKNFLLELAVFVKMIQKLSQKN